jgi:hypothetical protein
MILVFDDILERPPRQKLVALAGLLLAVAFPDWTYFYGPRQADRPSCATRPRSAAPS